MKPRSTYRLQFHKSFGFDDAARIAPYLARLGVSHIYASPWLKARPGSSHGYDIVDHHSLNPELGDEAAFERMVAALEANHIGSILDFVPNHMGVGGADNPLWLDVLEWGPDSSYAGWFDIDWEAERVATHEKLLIPLLAKQYGAELYDGRLTLEFDSENGSFAVWAYDTHKLPICPLHYKRILGDSDLELERLGDSFASIGEWRPQIPRRARQLKTDLANAAGERPEMRAAIDSAVARFNGTPGEKETWAGLHSLIQDQYWRVAHFRVAGDDINYRRFFDINELAGLRMELPEVFEHAHGLVFSLLRQGKLNGLRIDHVDGLLSPKGYLERLRAGAGGDFYLIVEKILAHHESLREDWPVDGTTGYEFANLVLTLLIDQAGETSFTRCYVDFANRQRSFPAVVRECKLRIMANEMASELNVLAREALRVACQQPETADFTHNVLRRAMREIIACFPVYRTYVDEDGPPTTEDRRDLEWAMKQARAGNSGVDPTVFDFLAAVLSGDLAAQGRSGFGRHSVLRCAMKLQQYSGPVMAKGLEDTAFYRYNRFVALNEVGGSPDTFGASMAQYHKSIAQRARFWPHTILATATHDTKHGEDARARLAVLSELPEQWAKNIVVWSRMLRARRGDIEAAAPPDRNDEYLLFQLLIGSWPVEISTRDPDPEALRQYAERIKSTMRKSIREAKLHSTWARPNFEYEDAVLGYVDTALDPEGSQAFLALFLPFQQQVARLGMENSLVQSVLKYTAPGVPDIYQGAELWDLSLVDPDNRRPVDYDRRIRILNDLESRNPRFCELLERWQDGAVKLFVAWRILQLRTADPDLFEKGEYTPLMAEGTKSDLVCAFARTYEHRSLLVVTARFPARREQDPGWNGTSLPLPPQLAGGAFRNIFTGARLRAAKIQADLNLAFGDAPVAVFSMEAG